MLSYICCLKHSNYTYCLTLAVHLFVVGLIVTTRDILEPLFIIEIPLYCFLDAFLKLEARLPSQFSLQLGGVDGIAGIVSRSVGDEGDEVEVLALLPSEQPVDGLYDNLDDVDVLPLVEASDVVCFGNASVVEDDVDGPCMVLHIEPVADVLPLAVYRLRFAVADVVNEEGDELFGELVGALVVRAVCDDGRHAVGIVVSPDEMVAAGLCCGVGAVGVVACVLVEEVGQRY